VLVGNKEGTLNLDFSLLEQSDAKKESYFVVGGRAYFEGDVIGVGKNSFTAKGFFDKKGYVEPVNTSQNQLTLILATTIPIGILLIAGGVTLYCCCKKKKKVSHLD
jgi:hypothetical protein